MTLNPPFRADHVGSLLRTEEVKINRARWKNGEISAKTLHVIENRNIGETVKKLESIGIQSITDGEFRRDYFHLDFLKELEGVTVTGGLGASHTPEDGWTPPILSVTGKLKHVKNIQVDDFNFLKSVTTQTPKIVDYPHQRSGKIYAFGKYVCQPSMRFFKYAPRQRFDARPAMEKIGIGSQNS